MVTPVPSRPLPYSELNPYAAANWLAVFPPVAAAEGHDPGPMAGTTAGDRPVGIPPEAVELPWLAGTSWAWGVATVLRPTTPATEDARTAGTDGCCGANPATL